MKKRMLTTMAIVGVTCLGSAHADVVMNTNVTWSSGQPSFFGQYQATVCQTTNCDYTETWFNKVNKYGSYIGADGGSRYGNYSTLTTTNWAVDEEADYYLVPYEAEFSAANIASGQFSPLFVLDHPYSIDVPFGTFYLGVNTGTGFSIDGNGFGVPGRSVFGWMRMNNSSTGLQMVSNAMAYGTNGIYIGTTDTVPVPEPETYAMMLAGLALVGAAARRRGAGFPT